MSLDAAPAESTGHLTFIGVSVFVQMLLGNQAAEAPEKIVESLRSMYEAGDAFLEASPLLSDLDPDSEEDSKTAFERLEEKRETPEWLALLEGSFAA